MAVDISSWAANERMVIFRATEQKRYIGFITGLELREDADGVLVAPIVVFSQDYSTGVYAVSKPVRRGKNRDEWDFIQTPQVIRDLEIALAEEAVRQAEARADEKRKEAADLKEAKEADFSLGGEDAGSGERGKSVRNSAVRASRL